MYREPLQGRGCGVGMGGSGEENGRVETLARGLRLLVALGEARKGLTLTELANRVDLPKPTAMRMLRTLGEFGFVSRDGRSYRVGPSCLALGSLYSFDDDLKCVALPVMRDLMQRTGEVVQLGVLKGRNILYLERVEPQRSVAVVLSRPGCLRPAHCTALGKAILSFGDSARSYLEVDALETRTASSITDPRALRTELKATRERGYAVDNGECDDEVRCVAAPIFDGEGRCVAALSVSTPDFRMPPGVREKTGRMVIEAARKISSRYKVPDLGKARRAQRVAGRKR